MNHRCDHCGKTFEERRLHLHHDGRTMCLECLEAMKEKTRNEGYPTTSIGSMRTESMRKNQGVFKIRGKNHT